MFLDTLVLDEQQNTYELEGTTTHLIHLWCGKCGVPTGTTGCSCYSVPKFVSRTKRLALNDYDETLTDYSTETGYVIAPQDEYDQTPVFSPDPQIIQPADDSRVLETWSSITDRFHPELMMNLKTDLYHAIAMYMNPRMKICKRCGYQQHYTTNVCAYC